jgi:uncharacterized protein YbjQ (UPF0145 family)
MRISHTREVEGGRVLQTIGRIEAASGWHASNVTGDWKNVALQRLIAAAQDFDADAIVDVDYRVDGVQTFDLAAIPLERVSVSGVAVKLARAA